VSQVLLARDRLENRLDILDPPRELLLLLQDRLLGRLKHAVETADDGEREDHPAVLGLLVVAAKEIGDRPDESGVVADDFAITHDDARAPISLALRMIYGWSGEVA
jgi:hypothetical protein